MASTLMFIESDASLISGIPSSIEIEASDPTAIIYYTTDESTPTPLSSVYTEAILTPTDGSSFTLRAIAYTDEDGYWIPSSVLSYTWSFETTAFFESHGKGLGGVAYIFPNSNGYQMWYDYLGNNALLIDMPEDELQMVISTTNPDGTEIPENGFYQEIASPEDTPSLKDNEGLAAVSMLGLDYFNPEAPVVLIDTRASSIMQPAVPVANGSFMTLRDQVRYNRGADLYAGAMNSFHSGQHINTFHNIDKSTMVTYYFDSVDCKWIKSVSTVRSIPPTMPPVSGYSNPLVLQWNIFGKLNTY